MSNSRIAILIGANGLVGNYCLTELLANPAYAEVKTFTRKPLQVQHPKHKNYVINFDDPGSFKELVKGNDVYCCLGTTIRKAGSQAAFTKVDHDYPLLFARLARENGADQFLIISALGAKAGSFNFYMRTKGEVEQDLIKMNFRSIIIFRPSMLVGPRPEFRLGELIWKPVMALFGVFMFGPLQRFKSVHAKKVADVMVKYALEDKAGVRFVESDEINLN